jgi:hypothetical protein
MMRHAWEARMDFIERIFGVSPDGGNGSLESFFLVSLAVVVFFAGYALYFRRKRRSCLP